MSKSIIEGDIETIKSLDSILKTIANPIMDSEGGDRAVYTKTYKLIVENKGTPTKLVNLRLAFDERDDKATVKLKEAPISLITSAGTYTLVQAGVLISHI